MDMETEEAEEEELQRVFQACKEVCDVSHLR